MFVCVMLLVGAILWCFCCLFCLHFGSLFFLFQGGLVRIVDVLRVLLAAKSHTLVNTQHANDTSSFDIKQLL